MNTHTLRTTYTLPVLAIFGLCVAFIAAPASAQVTDWQWELGFAVGNANIDSADEDFDLDLRADLRAGYFLTDHFELEAQLIRAEAPLDAQLLALMANGIFNFRADQRIVPYLLVGAGYSDLDDVNFLGTAPGVSEEAAAYQVGLGTRFFLDEERRMALRVELSNLWIDTDLFDNDRHTSLTAGLGWNLGRR